MKRICFLVDSVFSYGGVQCVTSVIAKALSAKHEVTIVTFDTPTQKDTSMYALAEAKIAYRFFAYPPVGRLLNFLCKAYSAFYRKARPHWQWASDLYAFSSFPSPMRKSLSQELKSGHYDIIIGVHAPLSARLATLRPQLKGVSCIGWIHNSFEALFSSTSLYIGPQLRQHYLYQLRKLDKTVVLSYFDARAYEESLRGLHPMVIYNPLTLKPGSPSQGTSKRFLAIGRLSHLHKGFDVLIDAFRIFALEDKEWRLDIVGEGPEEKTLRTQIADCGLEERVSLHPFTSHIQDYYSRAQVYVLSSRWEGFGLVLVEAMAHGLPVISSDLPTSREIMGEKALYFAVGDVGQLAQRLKEATRIDWKAKSAEAIETAKKFDPDTITCQWETII